MALSTSKFELLVRRLDENCNSAVLDAIATEYPADAFLLNDLIALAESVEPNLQLAATALLKRYHAAGACLSTTGVGRLLDLLLAFTHWESRLQILQMLPTLEIPESHADSLCDCLQRLIGDRNKFIRAWAYTGLYRLASVYPEFQAEVASLLRNVARMEVPSVRACLRQLPPL